MSFSDLASVGSFVSGFAVLVSLIYLSLQVKQAERNQQAAIRAARTSRIIDLMMGCTESSVAEAVVKGTRGAKDLSETQVFQFTSYGSARFFNAEDAFYQHREGLLNEFSIESVSDGLRVSFASPGLRAVYKRARNMLGREFVEFADALLSATPLAPDADLAVQFNADVAAERANTKQ